MSLGPKTLLSERIALTAKQGNIYVWGWQNEARFRFAVCGRRFGKTFLVAEEMRRGARLAHLPRVPGKNEIWYGAPTFKQAKRVFWRLLKRAIPRDWLLHGRWHESECCGILKSGHVLRIVGLDNYDDLRGSGLFFFVGDEWDDAKPEAWSEVILPMLATAGGHALFIGSPKGFAALYQGYVAGQGAEPDVKSWAYTSLQGGHVPSSEIDRARRTLDARTFRQEYEARFESFAGQVYYAFSRSASVRARDYDAALALHIGMDFNIAPMSATVWQEVPERQGLVAWQIDEIVLPTSNTHDMAEEIARRYGRAGFDPLNPDVSHITIYPDPAGAQSRTSAQGMTDLSILSARGFKVLALQSHPLIRDRINLVNARFESADGTRRAFVAPRCVKSIEALEQQAYRPGSSEPDKAGGHDHLNDATGYFMYARYAHKPSFRTDIGHMGR